MSNLQQSSEATTASGIQALEDAYARISVSRNNVDQLGNNLSVAYGGEDGAAYTNLLRSWDYYAYVIQQTLSTMIQKLNETQAAHIGTQTAVHDTIITAQSSSDAAFEALTGS